MTGYLQALLLIEDGLVKVNQERCSSEEKLGLFKQVRDEIEVVTDRLVDDCTIGQGELIIAQQRTVRELNITICKYQRKITQPVIRCLHGGK
jgi:hypothetical protein